MDPLPHRLFWLHVKKSGGTSTRAMFGPAYLEVERTGFPCGFLGRPRAEWNDILNNFRVPLGVHQFRRSLFARDYLYPEWDDLVRLAFVREPVSRCVSMFHYMYRNGSGWGGWARSVWRGWRAERVIALGESSAFDAFLDLLDQRFAEPMTTVARPRDLHFTTHTARMWDDVTDGDGTILINRIWRLEDARHGILAALDEAGLDASHLERNGEARLNARDAGRSYSPSPSQRRRIEALYARDFGLYENALRA